MKFENTEVFNFEGALRGMRNAKKSWNRSDSVFINSFDIYSDIDKRHNADVQNVQELVIKSYPEELREEAKKVLSTHPYRYQHSRYSFIGYNDMRLAVSLIAAGGEHRKFLRQIMVSVDITAPIFYWKEFDTYKIGTVANSTSTMHKLTAEEIKLGDFEIDDFEADISGEFFINTLVPYLENLRLKYLETKDKKYWKELIRLLPESYLQTRTVTMNYENVVNMYKQRKAHRLNEWSGIDNEALPNFCMWAECLPYMRLFLGLDTLI